MIEAPHRSAPGPRDLVGPSGRLLGERTWSSAARGEVDERVRRWLRLALCCLVLAALPFLTRPGSIIADTKIDLAVNPFGFLERALHVWDPSQFGQLQDQAYGYFFPVGPFFAIGKLMAFPPWAVQRLWIAAILIAAFLGVVRLSARLGIGTAGSQITAGFAYALSAPALTLLGVLSSEWLPAAMLPWILLPIVRAVQDWPAMTRGARVRAVAQSATAVAMCSGINAAATIAVLIPVGIYLLAQPRPAPRWRIFGYWAPAVILATSWWTYPLLVLDKYGVSILPYTESAAVTTSATSLPDALRGTENWLSYLVVDGQPWWPVAYRIANETVPILLTGVIAGLGLAGLLGRRMPHRRFLLCVLLTGIFIILSGYVSGLGNPLAAHLDHAINGPLSPFRNVRKFDPLIRLPVALGLAHLLGSARVPRPRKAFGLVAAAAIGCLALPAYVSGITTPGAFTSFPGYWVSAADWLNQHAGNQGVLAVPGARFGQYTWGSPMDDVMEALSTGDWSSSQLSVIGSVGNTRLLEMIDQQMAAGEGSAGLTQLLARMDIKYVLVRNDLLRSDLRGAWPARIQQALAESPGIVKVAHFGQIPVGSKFPDDAVSNFDTPYPPVVIYRVDGAQPVATVQPVSSTLRVYGAPESLLTLADQGLLQNRPVLLNSDSPQIHAAATVVTDSLRRRTRNFGEIRDDYSATLTANQPATTFEATDDFTEPGWQPYLAVAQYHGIADVTASSSEADVDAIPQQSNTGRLPFAAVDGNLATMWESGSLNGPVGQWLRIDFDQARNPGVIQVAFADNRAIGPQVTEVEVSTAAGKVADSVRLTGNYQRLRVPPGASRWLQITVTGVFNPPKPDIGRQVGIAEISVPGVTASRTIVAPDVKMPGGGDPSAVVLAKAEPQPSGCMLTSLRWVCSPALVKPTEEQYGFDHSFTVAQPAAASLSGSAVLTSQSLIERYAFPGAQQPVVTGSSTYTSDPEDLPTSAFDGNPATSWIASPFDPHPTLTIRWHHATTVSSFKIIRPPGASGTLSVQVTGSGGQTRFGLLPASGTLQIAPMRTDSLTFAFTPSQAPLQISEVQIPGVQPLGVNPNWQFTLPCGFGPQIRLGGASVPTRVSGTFGDVLEGRPLSFSACTSISLAAGTNEVVEPSQDAFSVQSVVLDTTGTGTAGAAGQPAAGISAPAARSEPAATVQWTDSVRELRVSASSQSYLEVDQNFNSGWQAAIGGRTLQPVQLDGWKQGWLLPAGTHGLVTLRYGPQSSYSVALLGGLAAAFVVMIVALVPLRRRRLAGPAGQAAAAAHSQPGPPGRRAPSLRWPGRQPDSRVSFVVLMLAGVAVTPIFGLWIGGYPGAILLPASMVVFVGAIALRPANRIARAVAHPAVVAGLLVAASASQALGNHLSQTGSAGGGAIVSSSSTIPELLCLVIVGRMAAALAVPERIRHKLSGSSPPAGTSAKNGLPQNTLPENTGLENTGPENTGPENRGLDDTLPGIGPPGSSLPASGPPGAGPLAGPRPALWPPASPRPSTPRPGNGPPANRPPTDWPPANWPSASGPPTDWPPANKSSASGPPADGPAWGPATGNGRPGFSPPSNQAPGTGSAGMGQPGNRVPGSRPPGSRPPESQAPGSGAPGNRAPANIPPQNRAPRNGPLGVRPPGNGVPGNGPLGVRPPGNGVPGNGPLGVRPPGNGVPGNGLPGNRPPETGPVGNRLPGSPAPGTGQPGNRPPGTWRPGNRPPWSPSPDEPPPGSSWPEKRPPGTRDQDE
jgi:arabinofuranan 3-O-arabinosyltransferase